MEGDSGLEQNGVTFSYQPPPPKTKHDVSTKTAAPRSPARYIISKECNSPCRSSGAGKSDGVQIFLTNSPHIASHPITLEMKKKEKCHQMKLQFMKRFTNPSVRAPGEGSAACCWAMSLNRLERKRQDSHICFPSEVGMQNEEYI